MMRAVSVSSAAIALLFFAGCNDGPGALVVRITSSLEIPNETNTLVVRVLEADGTATEKSYALGDPPRDAWPQTLPVIAGEKGQKALTISAELRMAAGGAPSTVVGYGETEATLPRSGERTIELDIPPLPSPPQPDAGTLDAPDGSPPDAGAPPAPDSGVIDAGRCTGNESCLADETCFMGYCRDWCCDDLDCPDITTFYCELNVGVCNCRAPCDTRFGCAMFFTCIDGCCELQ